MQGFGHLTPINVNENLGVRKAMSFPSDHFFFERNQRTRERKWKATLYRRLRPARPAVGAGSTQKQNICSLKLVSISTRIKTGRHEDKFGRKKPRFCLFRMPLKYIFFNFVQLKLSVAYNINFPADKISCHSSVYGLITFCKEKNKTKQKTMRVGEMQGITIKHSYLPFSKGGFFVICYPWISPALCLCFTSMTPGLLGPFRQAGLCWMGRMGPAALGYFCQARSLKMIQFPFHMGDSQGNLGQRLEINSHCRVNHRTFTLKSFSTLILVLEIVNRFHIGWKWVLGMPPKGCTTCKQTDRARCSSTANVGN